uniref:Putative ATPase domain containing protein n=2 Tax=viral metagenome TaxID=1070528 RepID=A0A6M3IV89_9ZZZZ
MFQLRYLECHNFFSFENVSIRFTKGMTLITGYDDGGKDSNGSGKSTILNAVCWALFGRTLKGVQGQDVVQWEHKNCKVILILEGGGHVYEITRKLDSLIFKIDKVSISGHHRDIQSSIEDSFKTNYALFIRSTAFSQSQVEFLAASGDADKKRLFKEILSLSRLDRAYERIKTRYETEYSKAERLESELGTNRRQKDNIEEKILKAQESHQSWEEDKATKIKEINTQKNKTPPSAEPLNHELAELAAKVEETVNIQEQVKAIENRMLMLSMEENQYSKEIKHIWDLIEKGTDIGSRCELCGSIVNGKMLGAHKREMEDKITGLKTQREALMKEQIDAKDRLQSLYATKLQNEKISTRINELKTRLMLLEHEWDYYKQTCIAIDSRVVAIEKGANPYEQYLTTFTQERDNLEDTIQSISKQFEETKKNIDTLAFLKFTLSREGVVSHIIEREYSTLVSYANRMLSDISGGKLRVEISPQKELKSGALKEEISISVYVNNNKTPYWGISDGQRQRVNIALLLALNKLCKMKGVNSFDFLLLDEVLDISLAEGGQQDVLLLLKNYMRECHSIILISHKDTFKSSFNSCLSVYRDHLGISHLTR